MIKFFKSLYISNLLYYILGIIIALYIFSAYFSLLYTSANILLLMLTALIIVEAILLWETGKPGIEANRVVPEKLSNGDANTINLEILNRFNFKIKIKIIDELPIQFQKRDFLIEKELNSGDEKTFSYTVRPVKRGVYIFGKLNIYASVFPGILQRRFIFNANKEVKVYPSFIQMQRYEFLALSNHLTEIGTKKIRKISRDTEFEQIREYIPGDDIKSINWKATARRNSLMINQFQEEKAQPIYCITDMGRTMKMPFREMSLLDYAINTSLALANIALIKSDHPGLITFNKKMETLVPASRKNNQIELISEALYNPKTDYAESDFERLYADLQNKIRRRSLFIIFTNFEGMPSLQRQLSYLSLLAKSHLILVVFFQNTEVQKIQNAKAKNIKDIYTKTAAEKIIYDKDLIIKELKRHGIHSILTPPEELSIQTINKYLEFKSKGFI